jgi:hypothetical protein
MPTNAELTAQLTEMTKRATDAEARVGTLTSDLAAANDRAAVELSARLSSDRSLTLVSEQLRDANASLKAYKGSATKARNQVTILKRELSPEARPFGALAPAKTDEAAATRAQALAAAFAADTTELVFSDGRREIRELAPLVITGDAWRDTPNGRVLNAEIDLEPGDCMRETMELRGFALLNEAGDQVGYCRCRTPS